MKSVAAGALLAAICMGCSSGNQQPAEKPAGTAAVSKAKPTEALLGRAAMQQCYITARGWAVDAQLYSLESQPTKEVTGAGGKSAIWTARFGSLSRATSKTITWSGSDADDAPARGINPGAEDSFNPSNSYTRTFDLAFLKSDSDQAFLAAQAHGGKPFMAKNPALPVVYRLGWAPRDNALVWHVLYGGTGTDQKLAVAVNASSGQFMRVER
jgi:hypothetical protein